MGSVHRRYRRNSPQAVARVLADLLTGDAKLDPREIDFMDRLGVFGIVGVPRALFMQVAADLLGELRERDPLWVESRVARTARLDAALDAIDDREQQHLLATVLLYLAEADGRLDEEEIALVRHVFERWQVSATTLARELKVPWRLMRKFFDTTRLAEI